MIKFFSYIGRKINFIVNNKYTFIFIGVFSAIYGFTYFFLFLSDYKTQIFLGYNLLLFLPAVSIYFFASFIHCEWGKTKQANIAALFCLTIVFSLSIISFKPDRYFVIIKPDRYKVIRDNMAIVNPLEILKAEDNRVVFKTVIEREFYKLETCSFHFMKLEVESQLRVTDSDAEIYKVSRYDKYTSNYTISDVKSFIEKELQAGEVDKKIIEQKALEYFQKNPPGPWVPTKIKILSLKKI